jgi:hypothetical protein
MVRAEVTDYVFWKSNGAYYTSAKCKQIKRRIIMKTTIPVDEKSLSSNVCVSFGRTPYFLIYDTDTQKSVSLDNSAAASTGGAGIKAAQMISDNKVNILLIPA